jgi:molybdate transport system substrate-binding protein
MRTVILILPLLLALSPGVSAAETIRVAVAANFRATLASISARFESETGYRVLLSSASTGVLYSQILHGAPFDLFFAADQATPARLVAQGRGESYCYARGSLVLVGGSGELSQLADPALSVAIANPETAPYGAAAMQVLSRAEFAAAGERRVIRGNNVAQAYQFWHSGGTDLALVAASLAPGSTPVPPGWHQPVEQHAVVLGKGAGRPEVRAYIDWIRSDRVRSQILDAGYLNCP